MTRPRNRAISTYSLSLAANIRYLCRRHGVLACPVRVQVVDDGRFQVKDGLVDAHEITPPPVLYHYTSAQGLAGIIPPTSWNIGHPDVDTKLEGAAQLQASDVRFMNDSQELQFGASIFERRFRAAATDQAIPANVRALVQRLADTVSHTELFGMGLRCFAACFNGSGDLLSQWRGYAGGSGKFSSLRFHICGSRRNCLISSLGGMNSARPTLSSLGK